jgi:hypothetical protein
MFVWLLSQAGPGAILQLYIVLRQEQSDPIRIIAIFVSGLALATTLAWDTSPIDTTRLESLVCAFHTS